jgi:hypothetical protein
MSQVHSVTHVPVHSPLSEACLPYSRAQARTFYWGGVAGRNRPAVEGGEGLQAEAREDTSSLIRLGRDNLWNLKVVS